MLIPILYAIDDQTTQVSDSLVPRHCRKRGMLRALSVPPNHSWVKKAVCSVGTNFHQNYFHIYQL